MQISAIELAISAIELEISAIDLEISAIQLEISAIQLEISAIQGINVKTARHYFRTDSRFHVTNEYLLVNKLHIS